MNNVNHLFNKRRFACSSKVKKEIDQVCITTFNERFLINIQNNKKIPVPVLQSIKHRVFE